MPKPTKPVKQDPDSFLQNKTAKKAAAWLATAQEYLSEYLPATLQKECTNPQNTTARIKTMGESLELISDRVQRKVYYEAIKKKWPAFGKNYSLQPRKEEKAVEKKKGVVRLKADEWTYTVITNKNEMQLLNGKDNKLSEEQIRCIKQYGFVEHRHGYYFGELNHETQTVRLFQKSNFTLRLLYHIKRSKNRNKRVVALTNQTGRSEVIDIETKQLVSLTPFREFTEGAGFFMFNGDHHNLTAIKTKLLEEERQCTQLDTLGWQKSGFFAFSNGIIREGQFVPVDEFGIVDFSDRNYFIPYHHGTDESQNINEKRFAWKPGPASWEQWSKLYYQVFGDGGMITMLFGCATLFSDHIFLIKTNFPILFLYGEGGSGKSKMIQFIQHWFGDPQSAMKVSEKANTDKSKIRKMAQFSNAVTLFEEFINGVDTSIIKTFTGFYDRFGYERATIEGYQTETVPVNSTVVFTGNEYPNDDPFLQRTILIDHNVNQFTEEQQKRFDELNKLNRKGLTQVTMELLKHRGAMVEKWEDAYEKDLAEFKKLCWDVKVPSRMLENNAVLIGTFTVLSAAGVVFPFKKDQFTAFLRTVLVSQANKRDVGGATQRFWDIVVHLLSTKKIEQGKHLEMNGDRIMARVTELHGYYMLEHYSMYRQPALNKTTLLHKLRDSPAFLETKGGYRFSDQNTSCYVFDCKKINVDFGYWLQGFPSQSGPHPTKSNEEAGKEAETKKKLSPGKQEDISFGAQKSSSNDILPF